MNKNYRIYFILLLLMQGTFLIAQNWDDQCGNNAACFNATYSNIDLVNCTIDITASGANSSTHLGLYIDRACGASAPDVFIPCPGGNCDGTFTLNLPSGFCDGNSHTFIARAAKPGNDCTSESQDVNLPIELLYFRGSATGATNTFEWATASEENNRVQILERSPNGESNFEEIGFVEPAGWSVETQYYSLEDDEPLPMGYYRIKSIDFDGYTQYSEVVLIERTGGSFGLLQVAPIPTADAVTVYFEVAQAGKIRVVLSDIFGRLISEETFESQEGIGRKEFDLSNEADGIYFISIGNGVYSSSQRVVKARR